MSGRWGRLAVVVVGSAVLGAALGVWQAWAGTPVPFVPEPEQTR
ncbi:hypothetical protein [Occultella kanbiaonis]|nr:hypothetical protein [Occultella kanbiaonis]